MRVFIFAAALFAGALGSAATAAPKIETGAELVSACEPFSKLDERATSNAVHPHHCHQFLIAFFSAFAEGDQAGRNAMTSGLQGPGSGGVCVHLPEFLSYRDMAARIVAQAKRDPSSLTKPAATLARQTLEHDFPCAPNKHGPR